MAETEDDRPEESPAEIGRLLLGVLGAVGLVVACGAVANGLLSGNWAPPATALVNRQSTTGFVAWMMAAVASGAAMVVAWAYKLVRPAWRHRAAGARAVRQRFHRTDRRVRAGPGRTGATHLQGSSGAGVSDESRGGDRAADFRDP